MATLLSVVLVPGHRDLTDMTGEIVVEIVASVACLCNEGRRFAAAVARCSV